MDINKLKGRLNLKFEPIQSQRKSLKKIELLQAKQKQKLKLQQSMQGKIRSNSQVKLPSLSKHHHAKPRLQTLEDSKSYVNVSEFKQRAKSFKQIPKVKIEGKQAINNTITFLMKNQILTVPRMVALLQKNQSDEFIYLKMTGIYEYEACDERDKGNSYVTVSKNGMVQNGELITLQTLVRQFELWKKLKKIDYFKNYHHKKYLSKWKQANLRVRFQKNRQTLLKELNLKDRNYLQWKIEIINFFNINNEGGFIQDNWIYKLSDGMKYLKQTSRKRLVEICFKMLESFDLPISESTELLNRVLGNLAGLNISFEKKIRIEKECEKFYKLGRQLELSAMQKTASFILIHLRTLITKVTTANTTYKNMILQKLQTLDVHKQTYNQQRQKILSDSAVSFDIDYTLYFNYVNRCLGIRPSPADIYSSCISQIKQFIKEMDKMGFKIIRTDDFKFVTRNVFKSGDDDDDYDELKFIFRNFVLSIPNYEKYCMELEKQFQKCQDTFNSRVSLYSPFLNLYLEYLQDKPVLSQFNFEQVLSEYEKIQADQQFCQKLDEGEYFIIGFLKTNEFKRQLLEQIKKKQNLLYKTIPIELNKKRQKLEIQLMKHLEILNNQNSNAATFIKISDEVEIIEQNLLEYSSSIDQIEKITDFYEKSTRNKLHILRQEKKSLHEMKIKMKSFLETRQNNFMKYRKSLQNQKIHLTKKIEQYSAKEDQFYDPKTQPDIIYARLQQITKNLKIIEAQLIELNKLQFYFNLKPTSFSSLQILIKQYENLQQIWKYTTNVTEDEYKLKRKLIKDINEQKFIKYYQVFKRKSQKYLKDPDLILITQNCIKKIQILIQNMQTIQHINSQHLRQNDLQQINYNIQRKLNIKQLGTIKCRQINYQKFTQYKISQLKLLIAEIVFKSKKQIQISQNLVQFNQWWKNIKLEHQSMDEYPWVIIFGENLKLRDQIDQYMTMLINVLNNKYGNFVRAQCNRLLKKLNNLAELLQLAEIHQDKFLNLFPILTSKYAQVQLSAECKKFDSILNKTMKNIKLLIKPTQNLNQSTKNILNTHIKHFDAISSVLSKFLQAKRLKFQRFYFLQDYQLLEVLVGIADEKNVFRMFQGVKGWLVQDGIKTGVIGIGDQHLVLKGWNYKNVQPELIFKSLQDSIKSNLNSIVRTVLYQYEVQLKDLKDLYQNIPWMCLYAVQMILFTKQVQLNCFHDNIPLQAQQSLIRQAVNHAIVKPSQYSNYITLLLHLLHFTEQMRKENVHSIFNFQWHSFLRFYYEKDNVMMRAMSNQIRWGGEYQGMWNLMVNTSDIKRAHICVLNNIQYANGVLLQGPSGTGKTQSLKELARCTAKYCVIFNCSQNVNLKTISKLLSGLCYTASWLCLDQINRLTVQAMSTIAKQIQTIRNAILSKKQIFNFMGKDIKLREGVAIFATMNPIYLKRAKLTENIKSYFRTITVSMPEHETILEVLLYGLKFYKPRQLAKKIGSSFSNLSIQLSKNLQYDFGLRAMKFLINSLSKRRTQSKNQNELIAKAFYDIFLLKLSPADKPIFQKVITDIFMYTPPKQNQVTMNRIVRMRQSPQTGTIVFGPVSMKSTLIKQYCKTYEKCEIQLYNPNSAEMRYFLGGSIHGRWQQGVVEKIARQSLSSPDKMHLLVLDSTLKSQIIENFNTLLDQSKLLTLSNGTRLKIHDNFKIIMQTQHLNLTSPSTITRCNLIYVCDKDVQTKSLIQAQLPQGLKKQQANKLKKIYSKMTNHEIRQVGKLSKIIISERYGDHQEEWKENQILGVEKAVIFAARILGIQAKIKEYIQKDNSFHAKKSPFHHLLVYERYAEGQFVQISRSYSPIIEYQNFTLKTSMQIFMKWLTKKATSRQVQPILWKGNSFDGKSKGIVFSLNGLKHIKISLNTSMSSSTMAQLLLPQILDKKNQQQKVKPQLIIYIQNLHMSNEQLSEQIRFMMENNKIFSVQAKEFVSIQALAFVAESRYFQTKQFDRVRRHFSEVTIPKVDQIQLKNIYYEILKYYMDTTNIQQTVKSLINIQSQRLCTYLAQIYQQKCDKKIDKNKLLGPYSMVKIIQRVKNLTHDNCRNISDFMAFMFESIRIYDQFSSNDQPISDQIILGYHPIYNGKFSHQYQLYLKNSNIILKDTTTLADSSPKKQKPIKNKQNILDKLESIDKNLYISQYLKSQIEITLRILENDASHYCLVSNEGSGRKTIFRSACKLGGLSYYELPQQVTSKQIKKIYFERMKKTIQNTRKEIILLNLQHPSHIKFLQFAEAVAIGSSVTQLFQSEQSDYMFASISDYVDDYNKSSKSYEEICHDYMMLAQAQIQFVIAGTSGDLGGGVLEGFPTLFKRIYVRGLPEFPAQSLVQCMQNILNKKIRESQTLKQNISIDNLPKIFMKIYKVFNSLTRKNKQNGVNHFNFNQLHTFKLLEQFLRTYETTLASIKQNEDIMNKSIGKISDINKILLKLRQEVVKTEPEVIIKRNRILEVVPVLEQKKKKTQSIKYAVQVQRKQIDIKNDEISVLKKQVEQEIAQSAPLLNQAIESIQTIKRNQLSEIKNNLNPHPLVKFTMENMVILLGQSDNWENVRKILSDANLLVRIKTCEPSHQVYLRVKRRISQNPEWTFDSISKISFGARYLFKWIKSMVKYKDIQASISKKKQYVQKLSQSLRQTQQQANLKQSELTIKQQDSQQIQKQYSKITKQLNDLQELMENNKRKLVNAQKIKSSLEENFIKWEEKIKYFKDVRNFMYSYNILLSLEVKIFPCLTTEEITQSKKQIMRIFTEESIGVPKYSNILFMQTITSQKNQISQRLNFQDMKDPKKLILSYHFNKKPLIIDPDNQASNWLTKLTLPQRIIYTKRTFIGANKTVEDAMKYGEILIVLVDGEIDVLCREILKSLALSQLSTQHQIQYNKNTFTLHQDFKILFCCKSKNPHISLTTSLNHHIINFQITKLSLQSNLLDMALKMQKPGLFQIKNNIQQNMQQTQRKIKEMETKIIDILLNNKKNLIEDESFIQLLTENKIKSSSLQQNKLTQQKHIEEIKQFINQFTKVCSESAEIFICLKQMSKVNTNLIWDVEIFMKYFLEACNFSISEFIVDEDEEESLIDAFGAYQFEEIHVAHSRPSTALSGMSLSVSRVASQADDNEMMQSQRTERQQQLQQKQKEKENEANIHHDRPSKPIFNLKTIVVNESEKGIVVQQRYKKIIHYLLTSLKKGLTQKQRYTLALLLILRNQKKQDLKILFNLMSFGNKKRSLQNLLDQNILTQNLKNYFSKIQSNKIEEQAHRIITHPDHLIGELKTQPSIIQVLMLGQIIAPENFLLLTQKLIQQKPIRTILQYQQLKVSDWLQFSDNIHPILLLMGQDPIQLISQYLQRKKYKNATLIAMGQDQGKGLDLLIEKQCRKQGLFIIHNFNIAASFMPNLIRLIQQFSYRHPHKNFRLILIGSLGSPIPQEVTSVCHKFIVQQPSGIKNKIRDLYKKSQSYIDHSIPSQHKLSYSLCLMHSIINQMQKYGNLCWNFPPIYTTSDFIGSIFAVKAICQKKEQIEDFQCNIEREQIQKELNQETIDFAGLRYLIGETCYVGKMSDNIDRKKMRIIVENHFNQDILHKNYVFWQQSKLSDHPGQVEKCIQSIEEQNPKTCGLYQNAIQSRQLTDQIFNNISTLYFQNSIIKQILMMSQPQKFTQLKPITHRLNFITEEINNYNANGVFNPMSNLLRMIDENTRVFNLKAFTNPRQLFVTVKLEMAVKNNVPYDQIVLVWSFVQKEGFYGVSNLNLEGGSIKNGVLVPGLQQKQITLYFSAVLKKKDKDPNKGKVGIPLYWSQQRGELIDNYGQNTNLLTEVYLDSKQSPESWIVKGTAFVAA